MSNDDTISLSNDVDNDIAVVSSEQDDEDKNIVNTPESEDSIALKSPAEQGEESVSGDAPDPESDDDTLLNAHAVGAQLNEDLEHPQELDSSESNT